MSTMYLSIGRHGMIGSRLFEALAIMIEGGELLHGQQPMRSLEREVQGSKI